MEDFAVSPCSYYKYTGHLVEHVTFGKVTLKHARSYSNNVAVIACIQSDLMYLLVIALTFVCVIEAQASFYFYNIRDVFQIQSMFKVFNVWAWVLFLGQTKISEVFKIVSRGDDKR